MATMLLDLNEHCPFPLTGTSQSTTTFIAYTLPGQNRTLDEFPDPTTDFISIANNEDYDYNANTCTTQDCDVYVRVGILMLTQVGIPQTDESR